MKNFLKQNKRFWAVVIWLLLAVGIVCFLGGKSTPPAGGTEQNQADILDISGKKCASVPKLSDDAVKLVTKVIDGDTFLIEGGHSVRILGIDADEDGYPCYQEAKTKLEELILNKEVKLEREREDLDQYCRYLRYVFFDGRNISLELIKQGLAVARFSPENSRYTEEIVQAEKSARENKIGCKWSFVSGTAEKEEANVQFQWEKLTAELTGLRLIDVCRAENYYGEEIIIEGKVASASRSKSDTIFLNFGKPYPNNCFTGVIFSSDQPKFIDSPERYYYGKTVRLKGEIKKYQGKPEIILKEPSQIEAGDEIEE